VVSPQAFAARDPAGVIDTIGGETMGTRWSLRFVARPGFDALLLAQRCQEALDRVVGQMSNWLAGSDLDRFNRARPGSWYSVEPDFFRVIRTGLEIAEASEGAFDPTSGPLVDLWGFGPAPARLEPPSPVEIADAMLRVGWQQIALDRPARRIFQPGGAAFDLSGIAKGYAVDLLADTAAALGVTHVLAEIGGELVGRGVQPDGQPWWVEVELPSGAALPPTRIALHELAVATSGDYRRFFYHGGRRYAHSIDPRTGHCVDNGVASVTVVHRSCLVADALATALTVLGPEAGMAFASTHGHAALFTLRTAEGYEERLSPALSVMLD
jgi:thiamine biosynthesis lipoprotein